MQGHQLKGWRRVASAIWQTPRDPQIYGQLDVDAGPMLAFIEAARKAGHHLTPTHMVARALTAAFEAVPELNVRIVGSRCYPRPSIELFFIASLFSPDADLSGVKVDVTRCTALDLAVSLERGVTPLRAGSDRAFARSKRLMDALPSVLLRAALRGSAWLTERLQWDVPALALHKSPFGSAIISSIGSLGLPHGFAPLSWLYDVPLLLLVGEISDKPVVVEGRVVVRPMLPLTVTIDHRYVDGSHISRALTALRGYLQAPESYEPGFGPSALAQVSGMGNATP
ncbi:MAG: hypothetical protein RLZZ450_1957 [Pseudomonadota bacterium]|jgi:pyruvate dehydrogenase E2 component (dihydrolipoamide acetyltransferase)